jgi:hypothetical protein
VRPAGKEDSESVCVKKRRSGFRDLRRFLMKRVALLVLTLILSACSNEEDRCPPGEFCFSDNFGINAPQPLRGDEDQVVIYDVNGIVPAKALHAADGVCSYYGKRAEFLSQGGDSSDCVSNQLNLCATYRCQ